MKYTVPQKTAVYYNRGNLLLSAAAGSGKTASLTRRIVRLILDGEADISELLVVTFTRAAAAEMRGRIRRALAEAVEKNRVADPAVSRRAAEAIAGLPSASISTIHSFLYREMRQYFPALGMAHDTRIADTGVSKTMRADAMRDTVDDYFAKTGEDGARFSYLADVIGQARDTAAVDRELLWLADKLTSCGGDERTLLGFADSLSRYAEGECGFFVTQVGAVALSTVRELAAHYLRVFTDLAAEFAENPDVAEKYGDALAYIGDWLRLLNEKSGDGADFASVRESFRAYAPPKLGSLSSKKACRASEKFKFFRDRLKADVKTVNESFFTWDEAEIKLAARDTAQILALAAEVIGEYFSHLREAKLARSLIDYADLEVLATSLFVTSDGAGTDAAREVGGKFKYIFIDEYQDTNAVQDAIFRAISGGSVRFMVGDIKQSIYRFRGADPRVFSEYRRRWEQLADGELISDEENVTACESLLGEDGRSLLMSDNFRCDSAVIDFVNMISDHTLAHGGIPYTAGDRLICSKNGGETPKVPVEVVLIEKKRAPRKAESDDAADDEPITVSGNAEAAYVASRIAAMIGKYSASGESVTEADDIAILMRSPSSAAEDYERELALYGIPSVTKASRPVTSYPSVMLVMCLLNFIDNPMRDIYAAGALRSAVFGFTLGDIIALREMAGDMPIFTALERCSENGGLVDGELSEKCARAKAMLDRYKIVSRGMTADRFLEFLIRDANLYSIDGIRASGDERGAIDRLCDMARVYESCGIFGGISGFIDYVAEASAEDEAASQAVSGGVQIMSIHSSKGLEFPVVFLAECGKRRNTADESGTVLFDDALGLGMMLPCGGGLARCDTALRRTVAAKLRRESIAEEMRMLYVALTRAESRLIVTGKCADAAAEAASAAYLAEYADGYDVCRASRYLDWIAGAAAECGERDFYTITAIDAESIESGRAVDDVREADAVCELDAGELEARFAFEYPREYLAKIPSKLTVSRLYPEILDEDSRFELSLAASAEAESDKSRASEPPRPSFMTGETGSGAMRGSATHVFMQFASFSNLTTCGARAELERLRVGGFISAASAELVDLRQIERFAGSSLMDKLTRSDMVKREFRFNVRMDASEFTDDAELKSKLAAEGVKLTVQGVVDCVFRDPDTGELVLIDYKTDRVSSEEWRDPAAADAAFRERHKNQLAYYKRICARLFCEEISGAFVYSTVLGRCIEI